MSISTKTPAARFFTLLSDYNTFLHSARSRAGAHTLKKTHAPPSCFDTTLRRKFYTSSVNKSQRESLKPQTHYELFPNTLPAGPPPQGPFAIDVKQLRKEFLQIQAKTHPDLHIGENKSRAEGMSALINEAYKTLQSPLSRAQYLLSLKGIDVAEDETLKIEDPELLMEVLETRENIEAAEEETELDPLKDVNEQRMMHSIKILDEAFKQDDITTAKEEAVRLRYWANIGESLHSWEKGKPIVLNH